MKHAMLLVAALAVGLATAACGTGRPQPLDRLYTPPILSQSTVICAAVNGSPSPVLMAVEIFDAHGSAITPSTVAVDEVPAPCGIVLAWHGCRVESKVPAPQLIYCRISVPNGQKDFVRGSLKTSGIAEAR